MRLPGKETILSTDQYVAQTDHSCDVCQGYIMPGELYERRVIVTKGKNSDGTKWEGLYTRKEHVEPQCDPPDEEELFRNQHAKKPISIANLVTPPATSLEGAA